MYILIMSSGGLNFQSLNPSKTQFSRVFFDDLASLTPIINSLSSISEFLIFKPPKVFLNVCGSHAVPCPPEITDRELQERVESAEEENLTVAYRVPISLGAPRVEKDNKKLDCDVFDIVVNEAYLKSIEENQQKYQIVFMVSVGLQGQSFHHFEQLNSAIE